MQITRTVGIETAAAKTWWEQFLEWWNSLQQWQQALIVLTPIAGTITYLIVRK